MASREKQLNEIEDQRGFLTSAERKERSQAKLAATHQRVNTVMKAREEGMLRAIERMSEQTSSEEL